MADNNVAKQAEEIEALRSIYGDDFCVVDQASRIYGIHIVDSPEKPRWKISLQVIFSDDYPSSAPPQYQLNASWLRGQERMDLSNALEEIYCENIGESVVFLWVEKIREFLQQKAEKSLTEDTVSPSKYTKQSEETDYDYTEDGFDPALVQHVEDLHIGGEDKATEPDKACECPVIFHGEPMSDRKSTFQAHLAQVVLVQQVKMVLDKLLENKKIAMATHNIVAYRICRDGTNMLQGCEDDGETQAGSRMLHLMQIVDAKNVMVVVTRWYGGVHLGPDRFKHINNCTRSILEEHGFIKEKEGKKGPRSSKSPKKHR